MINIAKFQDKINKHYPNEHLTVLEYKGARDSCIIRCEKCKKIYSYAWSGGVLSSKKKILCHDCQDRILQEKRFQEKIQNRFCFDDLVIVSFIDNDHSCTIKCNKCGEEYSFTKPAYVFHKTRNYFCSKCFPLKNKLMEKAREKFKIFINSSSNWELAQSIDFIHSDDLVQCKCLYCGRINKKTIYDYMRGRGCFCQCNTEQKTTEDFINELDDDYELIGEYKSAFTKVTLRHKTCGFIYKVTPHNYLTGKRCPRCSRMESKGERRIRKFLENKNIPYIKEYPEKIEGHNLRFDFYLPKQQLYIEYQGEQHYHPIDYFGGEERFLIQCELDKKKRNFAGDKLIEIKYDEDIESILINTLKFNDYPEKE